MTQTATARNRPAQVEERVETVETVAPPETAPETAPGAAPADKVVGLHGAFVAPDPGGPNIDLFDNVPV